MQVDVHSSRLTMSLVQVQVQVQKQFQQRVEFSVTDIQSSQLIIKMLLQ